MDENGYGDKASSSLFSRYRSPSFRKEEVTTLVEIIAKYRHAILNKATNATANYTKEMAWSKIAEEFNSHELGFERSMDVLKTKWENLKRSARKLSKDVMDEDNNMCHDEIVKTVAMICATEYGQSDIEEPKLVDDILDDKDDFKPWACVENNIPINAAVVRDIRSRRPKKCKLPIAFSPRDCRLLLQCVRQEKNVLFSKTSVIKRHQAWKRIANSYNRQSPRKKTAKELNRKFTTMKAMAKKIHMKGYFKDTKRKEYDALSEDNTPKIKSEPVIDCVSDFEYDTDDDKTVENTRDMNSSNNSHLTFTHDPLANVHNSDSGLGSISDNKDLARLKIELLNYEMETARLQRKRVEEAVKADEKEREVRALEHSLRLRAARLEVIAAESKLPTSHAALKYTAAERIAQQYLCNAQLDIG